MGLLSLIGSKIDFWEDPIFESAAWCFVVILKFIFTPIFEIKIHEKNFLDTKKISFSKSDLSSKDSYPISSLKTLFNP